MSASAESNENYRSKEIAEDLYNGIRVLRAKKQMESKISKTKGLSIQRYC